MQEKKPKVNSASQKELDKAEKQFEAFEENVKSLTMDRMNQAPVKEEEPQTKLSVKDIDRAAQTYLKPHRIIGCRDKFNEDYRKQYEYDKEYIQFVAENREIIGETIDIWTRPYGGLPAEWWKVPVNKPVWGPRYLAEQIKSCKYHQLKMEEAVTGHESVPGKGSNAQFYGSMIVDSAIQRLDAHKVTDKRSVFMGSRHF